MLNCFLFSHLTKLKQTNRIKRTPCRPNTTNSWFTSKTSSNNFNSVSSTNQQIKSSKLNFYINSNNGNNFGSSTSITSSKSRLKSFKIGSRAWRHPTRNSGLWRPKCSFSSWSGLILKSHNQCRKVCQNKKKLTLRLWLNGRPSVRLVQRGKPLKTYGDTRSLSKTFRRRDFTWLKFGFTSVSLARSRRL